jgi:hypothetical protein
VARLVLPVGVEGMGDALQIAGDRLLLVGAEVGGRLLKVGQQTAAVGGMGLALDVAGRLQPVD